MNFKKANWILNKKNYKNDSYNFIGDAIINHENIFSKYSIKPESLEFVSVDYIIQKSNKIRQIIKQLDILLKFDGIFELILIDNKFHSSYFLSRDQVKYEFSLCTDGRYILINKKNYDGFLKLTFKKKKNILSKNDSINNWSFGLPYGGNNDRKINDLINSIIIQNIPNYEIIICGPYINKLYKQNKNIRVIDDINLKNDIRIPICHKKNAIVKSCKYENIVILHDRFLLSKNWFVSMKKYGNYFDFLCLPTYDESGNRFAVDWMKFNYPLNKRFSYNNALSYDSWDPNVIVQGGVMITKRKLIKKYLLDERLHWEEFEDMHLSKIAYLDGSMIAIDPSNYFISKSVNHKSTKFKVGLIFNLFRKSIWIYSLAKSYFYFRKIAFRKKY